MQGLWKLYPATGTHGNVKWSSRFYFCLMTWVGTLGPSEHEIDLYPQRKHPTMKVRFCVQPRKSLANLGSNRDASLQANFRNALIHLSFLHFFLRAVQTHRMFCCTTELPQSSVSHPGHRKAKRREGKMWMGPRKQDLSLIPWEVAGHSFQHILHTHPNKVYSQTCLPTLTCSWIQVCKTAFLHHFSANNVWSVFICLSVWRGLLFMWI